MTDLVVWLRTQLDTDQRDAEVILEAIARSRAAGANSTLWDEEEAVARRTLRQVQAHRAILDGIAMRLDPSEPYGGWEHADAETDGMASNTLRALVSIYSDRDGFKEEWSA